MTDAASDLREKDIQYSLHPYTHLAAHEEKGPLTMERGENIYVWDSEGNRYIEGLAGLWCTSLGFSEKRLVEAARRQLEILPYTHTFAHRSSPPVIELCERLIDIAPHPMARAFLVASGSEAIDTAIKFVWYYNNALGRREKKKVISRQRGYHGVTIAGGSLTAIPLMQTDFDLPLDRFLHTDTPCYYRYGEEGESEEEFATRLADNLDRLIQSEDPDTVAAFVAEPVMGAGGVMPPPRSYFEKVQKVLKKHDVLFVADEVICGFGRTGNMWGSQTYDIAPDIVTCAKQLSSAYMPIAAIMIDDEIYRVFREQSKKHGALGTGYTYGGHPVAAAVALETLKIYEERNIMLHVNEVSSLFQQRLRELGNHALVGDARGVGLIGGLEIVSDKASRAQYEAEVKAAPKVFEKALREGLVVRALPGDTIGVCPPLIITREQINDLFDRLERAFDAAETELPGG
ncbi:MAG: Putrescine--pyruvate aminotransferase [Gammaproteobacteria bacterium]|nr:Putrescine--pyruvate aminotransferase [Gammaproteobacteria bacterium]